VDPSSLTPQQKMLGAAAANILFAISLLFFPWIGEGSFSFSGWDVVPSSWIFLILALLAAAGLAAAAFDYELPIPVNPLALGAYCSSVVGIETIAVLFEFSPRKWGMFFATLFALAAVVLSVWVWRQEEA